MACRGMGCNQMGQRAYLMGRIGKQRRAYLMGGDLEEAIESNPPEVVADAMVETGRTMYEQGHAAGQNTGLLYGILIGAGILLLIKR